MKLQLFRGHFVKSKTSRVLSLTATALTFLFWLSSAANAYQQVIDLGYSEAWSINSSGQIVGIANGDQACLFDKTGGGNNKNLGTLSGNTSEAYSINNNGQIVGTFGNFGLNRACLFDSANPQNNKDLGCVGTGIVQTSGVSYAYSINNNSKIVGESQVGIGNNGIGDSHACLFDSANPQNNKDLGTLGGQTSLANSINNNNQIVGGADNSSGKSHACLFNPANPQNNLDLGTLGGLTSTANSINDSGVIVGCADNSSGKQLACIFDSANPQNNIDLGDLGGLESYAHFINNKGQIVGTAKDDTGYYRACLFSRTGNTNLNDLIDPSLHWTLTDAYCINDNGWIVGFGMLNGAEHAFLLTPEPTTLLLLAFGGLFLRRKK